jgi:hypothetical protein
MKFTKEVIETAREVYGTWTSEKTAFISYLDSLLKPETKKIVVEIEYEPIPDFITEEMAINLTVNDVRDSLKSRMNKGFNIKVTELPEVFSREDMIEFAQYNYEHSSISKVTNLNNWLSERSKK